MKNKAISNVQIDNNLVRVTKYSFMPGQETGMHKHFYDYIVTPITDGKLLLIDKHGKESNYNLTSCQSYFRKAGIEVEFFVYPKYSLYHPFDSELSWIDTLLYRGSLFK